MRIGGGFVIVSRGGVLLISDIMNKIDLYRVDIVDLVINKLIEGDIVCQQLIWMGQRYEEISI